MNAPTVDASTRPRQQRDPRPGAAPDAAAARQVRVWLRSGLVLSPACARTVAAWWHSPAGGAITTLSHTGKATHWLAYECEREARFTGEHNQAELAALAAYGRHMAGYGYEDVIYLDGDDYEEANAAANAHPQSWTLGMFEHLMQWEYGDSRERSGTPRWGSGDREFELDGYVLAINYGLSYVSLNRIVTEPEV